MEDPVWRNLNTLRSIIERLIRDHRTVTASMVIGRPTPNRSNIQTRQVTSPVESQLASRLQAQIGAYQSNVETALAALAVADKIRGGHCIADTAIETSKIRCDGGGNHPGAWVDLTCTGNAVDLPNGTRIDGVEHHLCSACRRRYYRWRETQEA